jgi:type I restriction enzyme S subunit
MAYVFYHIAQERFIEFATTNSKGDRPRTKWELFSKFPARIPPAEIRERIGSVLSAYDDLIENNLRRIKLLEESTRQLYKEWFVRLHFPGYEHTKLIEGVPEGWERKTLSEASESVNYGYTESAQTEEVGPKYLRITDIVPSFIDWSTVPYCPITERKKEKFSLREGDIVVARTGATVGYAKRLNKRHPEAVFASYLVRFRLSPKVSSIFIGTFIESDDYKAYVKSRIGGAAQPNANAKVLGDVKILIPSHQLQKEFDEIVSKLIDQKEILQIQNQKLKQTRDLLLPKLMSGEVEV